MHFPRYWSKGKAQVPGPGRKLIQAECWGWSDQSLADAQRVGQENAQRVAVLLADEERSPGRYGYGSRPVREEVLEEFRDGDHQLFAAMTRNSYGSLVLNAARAGFIDVDLPAVSSGQGLLSALGRLFGRAPKAPPQAPEDASIDRANEWVRAHPDWGFRVYRTFAGLRLLATHAPMAPAAKETAHVMQSLGADPLYIKLCENQESFRARLSPKPWRCGLDKPPVRYPYEDDRARAEFAKWERRYTDKTRDFATCKFITALGNNHVHEEIVPVIHIHDKHSRCEEALPLR